MNEFKVRLAPSVNNKKHNVFKLHKDDTLTWTETKMRRDNDHQPWQIKSGSGRTARRFKAFKEGGVGDNASYFVFYKPSDKSDTYEVCPVDEWYKVSATQRYKTLTAEEAEQKFEQRHKMLNMFSIMHLKKNGENDEEGGSGMGHDSKSFKVSELDDWNNSGDDDGSDFDDETEKKPKKKANKKNKEDPEDAPDEAKEESDEGDFEQREVDYMSDSSSSSSDEESQSNKDVNDVKGIAEEEALRDLLSTDDEEDAEGADQKSKSNASKVTLGTVDIKQGNDGNGSEESSDSDDYDVDEEKMDSMFMKKGLPSQLSMVKQESKNEQESSGTSASSSNTRQPPTSNKRKAPEVNIPPPQPPKRTCTNEISSSPPNGHEKIVEDLIRKYLTRKPMTLKILLKDIKSKLRRMEGVTPEMDNDLVNTIASIIKRLQPDRQKINDVIYLSLKS